MGRTGRSQSRQCQSGPNPAYALPIALSPSLLFASYPSEVARLSDERFMALDRSGQIGLQDMLALRNYAALNHIFTPPNRIPAGYDAVQAGEETVQAIATAMKTSTMVVERVLMWLLKYDFVRRIA